MGVRLENLSAKAFDRNSSGGGINRERFIESFKDDIIVIKTEGDNDGNFRDERKIK